ncbi:MaoC/PaaZ C-terminal domain-containing protein [Arthrobacter sp. W4I7]|uniref:MaoC/PaaZ C-terminal domain-containing protein n=1 Tax=Arthrobacter sp. W4I7 TaxID=3042296 RepID=UPI00277F14E7|nr:MaoC/PaaZ C-terminal domain-containing protein [Arthrobacter sp. W4I7]MDQ0691427.1 acyl dehydratase [Arthrobacter sp. W4I7]
MTIDLDSIGKKWIVGERSWSARDAMLYALGVGAGAKDPFDELAFTTENSRDVDQCVLPTFGVVLGSGSGNLSRFGDFPLSSILHAEQALTLHAPLPQAGTVVTTARVVDILDKGTGAMIITEAALRDKASGRLLIQNRNTIFARGEGGYGGWRGESTVWEQPAGAPDHVVQYQTRRDQALLYRLSGDGNPLHSDPRMAADSGFDRPILHGLCTFGFTGRALLHTMCDSDPSRFGSIAVRFASPVIPGDELTVRMWDAGDSLKFQTLVGDRVVLDRGLFTRRES